MARESATVGAIIPERTTLDGEEIRLRDRVLSLATAAELSASEQEEITVLSKALRSKRNEIETTIAEESIDRGDADALAEHAIGISRALSVLGKAGTDEDIEDAMNTQKVADTQRWISFVKEAKGGIDRGLDR